ncbi:MAG TPA: hypothetical protein PK509_12660, partial [Catalimonadaceae bacterium]|nr:hypothetical protein [Catalimonadaceae bacterium]
MRLVLLVFACLILGIQGGAQAQCTTGCTNTITLSSSSQTISYTFSSSNETLCIVKDGALSGSATITSGTINVSNRPNATICYGPGVIVASGVNVSNPNSQFNLNNYGTIQNSLNVNSNQFVVNNYGTISGSVSQSNGTINNMSGGTFSASSYNFNGGSFVNNSGAAFSLPVSFTIQNGASFSGAGSFSVTGNFATNNGASASIGGTASISGSVQSNAPITFSGATTIGGNLASNNGGPLTFGSSLSVGGAFQSNATVTVAGSLSVTGALSTNNGGPLTVSGATTIGGNVNTNATTTFSSSLAIGGALQINNGGPLSVTGAATITGNVQSNATTSFGSSVAIGGTLQVNNGGPITVTGAANVTGLVTINATTSIGGLATLGGGLTMNNGGNTTFSSGANITGNFTNNATATFTGNLNVSGTITNNGSGTITSSSGSCKGVCATSISNNGTISSTAGPNLAVCVSPSGSGSQSNVVVSVTPTAGPTGFSTSVSGSTVSGSFTAASPAPGGYIVLRKTSAIVAADLPVSGASYSVGSVIGGATVIATLNAATTTFSHSDGCGSFYYAVISSSSSSGGSCGSFYTTSYATSGPVSVSCAGNRYWVSSSSSNWNLTSNWSVSSGGPTGASVPTTGNLAIFDNARNGNCSVDATVDVAGIQISGYTGAISQNANPMTMRASGFSQSSGTFTGGSASFSINSAGLFSLTGGTFTSTSGNSTLSGNFSSNQTLFTHSAGTFNHNNGTWTLNPSLSGCANPLLSMNTISSTDFYNLTFNGVNGCGINANFGTATGDVVNVLNTLNHNDGVVSGSFSLKGNLTVGTGADAGYGTITVDGTGAQTYSSSTGRTCQLVVNKSAGSFTPSVATDLFVQSFTLSAGTFTAPTGTLNVGGQWGSSVTIFGHSGGTFNHNNGTVEFNPSLISCANPTLTVDVIPSTVFNNFTVNGIAGCGINATVSTASGDVVQGNGDFVHADGIIAGSFSFQGNLWIYAGADGGTGTLTANGTGAQTYYQATGSPRTCQIVVNKSAGTFTPAPGTTDLITQGFQLTAGTFTAPSGTLNVGGPWGSSVTIFGHSGGTFNHNNGTVEFNPNLISCANPTFTVDVLPATLFYNFTVNGIAGCGINATVSTASGDVIQGLNDFTHTDGIIAGSFAFQGNLIINAGADGGTGTITANGTGAQTYAQSAGSPRTCQIIVDKSAGALTPAGGTTDLITQGFQLLAGAFTAPSGTLNVGGSWGTSVTIFGHSGGTFTHNNGTVEFNPNLINCANPTFTVDVLPTTLFYNFTVNGVAGCGINATVSTASGDVVQGVNNFTHTDGIIAGSFAFQGNLIINSGADGGTGTITANGTGAQTYAQSAGTPRTCQIIVNKTSGAL